MFQGNLKYGRLRIEVGKKMMRPSYKEGRKLQRISNLMTARSHVT